MGLITDIAGWLCLIMGSAFLIIGAIGLLRLPDVFTRMHGSGIIDTLGAGLILVGLMTQTGFTIVTVKLFLILLFLLFTSPTATHALSRAALSAGVTPIVVDRHHPETEDDPSSKT